MAGRDGKGEDGHARTVEVELAVFFTQDKLAQGGVMGLAARRHGVVRT